MAITSAATRPLTPSAAAKPWKLSLHGLEPSRRFDSCESKNHDEDTRHAALFGRCRVGERFLMIEYFDALSIKTTQAYRYRLTPQPRNAYTLNFQG